MLQFKKVELNDLEKYNSFIKASNEASCENAFVNMLVWQCRYNNMLAIAEGQLIIKSGSGENQCFRLPFSDDFEKGMFLIKEYCGDKFPDFWVQEGERLNLLKELYGERLILTEHRNSFDYIYSRENLANLSGKKYHSKRNHISAFSKKNNWCYKQITKDNIEEIRACAELWYKENIHRLDSYMQCEKTGVNIILDNFDVLKTKGGAIYVDDRPIAFTLGSEINKNVFDIHIEKALSEYATAYTVINREFARNELSEYKYINREDDLGLEGLRKAKLSYHPERLIKKYTCRLG